MNKRKCVYSVIVCEIEREKRESKGERERVRETERVREIERKRDRHK